MKIAPEAIISPPTFDVRPLQVDRLLRIKLLLARLPIRGQPLENRPLLSKMRTDQTPTERTGPPGGCDVETSSRKTTASTRLTQPAQRPTPIR